MDIISQISISEVVLVFNLIFVLPALAYLLLRLRKYEARFGILRESPEKGGGRNAEEPPPPSAAGSKTDAGVYPYRARTFLSSPEKSCLEALAGALGQEVHVFPKVALWETVEATDAEPGYRERLHGKDFDFLVCDRLTAQPMTAIMFRPGRGKPAGPSDEVKKICAAAKVNLVFIDQAEEYDAARLKGELGIPDLEL